MTNCTFYQARDTRGNRDVGIKELDFRQLKDRKIFELATREAELLQSINHIEGLDVVKCLGHHSDEANGKFFIIMELLEGQTLQEAIDGGKRLEYDCVKLTTRLLDVVAPLHKLNPPVIHRDIRPANVMLCKDGRIKPFDFGFSVSDKSTGTTFCAINNFDSTAPEVAMGGRGDARSDLFSIAAIYLQLKTGKTAFDLCDMGSFKVKLPEGLSAADRRFLEKALAYVPDERFQSAAEMKAALPGSGTQAITEVGTQDPDIARLGSAIRANLGSTETAETDELEVLRDRAIGLEISDIESRLGKLRSSKLYSAIGSFATFITSLTVGGMAYKEFLRFEEVACVFLVTLGSIPVSLFMANAIAYDKHKRSINKHKKSLKQLEAELADKRRGLPAVQNEPGLIQSVKAPEADWSKLDLKDVEWLSEDARPCESTFSYTLTVAEKRGYVIIPDEVYRTFLDRIKDRGFYPARTGTVGIGGGGDQGLPRMIFCEEIMFTVPDRYVGQKITLAVNHPHFKIEKKRLVVDPDHIYPFETPERERFDSGDTTPWFGVVARDNFKDIRDWRFVYLDAMHTLKVAAIKREVYDRLPLKSASG